jgi:hypothetical protein
MINQRDTTGARAKRADLDTPWADFTVDGYGAWRAPLDIEPVTVQGQLYCNRRLSSYEWEQDVRAHLGLNDWLIGYTGLGCKCGACGPYIRCCHVCGSEQSVRWLAMRARLMHVNVDDDKSRQSMATHGTTPVRLLYEPQSAWQLMSTTRWAWGVPNSLDTVPSDTTVAPTVNENAWPCEFPPCQKIPASRFYRRTRTWIQNYCVGYWSAGRWIRSAIGAEAIIQVAGTTYPLSRMAFTNFTELTLTVASPTGLSYTFTVGDRYDRAKWVGEPQYLLISPWAPPQIRFCPIHDDECLDLVPGNYAAIAQEGAPIEVESQTVPILGYLWPGRNILQFDGFRLPGHPFHYSYDIVPQFI